MERGCGQWAGWPHSRMVWWGQSEAELAGGRGHGPIGVVGADQSGASHREGLQEMGQLALPLTRLGEGLWVVGLLALPLTKVNGPMGDRAG